MAFTPTAEWIKHTIRQAVPISTQLNWGDKANCFCFKGIKISDQMYFDICHNKIKLLVENILSPESLAEYKKNKTDYHSDFRKKVKDLKPDNPVYQAQENVDRGLFVSYGKKPDYNKPVDMSEENLNVTWMFTPEWQWEQPFEDDDV